MAPPLGCLSRACLLVAGMLLLALPTIASVDRGIMYIGSHTFDRIVDGRHHVLIMFDAEHAWHAGWDHVFEEFAQKLDLTPHKIHKSDTCDLVVGHMPVDSKHDAEAVNFAKVKKYGIRKNNLPVIMLWTKGMSHEDKPIEYPHDWKHKTSEELMKWARNHTGAWCGLRGQLQEFHDLAHYSGHDHHTMHDKAKELMDAMDAGGKLSKEDRVYAQYYLEVFEKQKHDASWPALEAAHIKNIIGEGGYGRTKPWDPDMEAAEDKWNILHSFIKKESDVASADKEL